MWKAKKETTSHIGYTSLRDSCHEDWYFDSGCSKHTIGENNYLKDLEFYSITMILSGIELKKKMLEMESWITQAS